MWRTHVVDTCTTKVHGCSMLSQPWLKLKKKKKKKKQKENAILIIAGEKSTGV